MFHLPNAFKIDHFSCILLPIYKSFLILVCSPSNYFLASNLPHCLELEDSAVLRAFKVNIPFLPFLGGRE